MRRSASMLVVDTFFAARVATAVAILLAMFSPPSAIAESAETGKQAGSGESDIVSTLAMSQDVYETGTLMRGEVSLTNRSAKWVKIPGAATLTHALSATTAKGKKLAAKNAKQFGAAKATELGPGGFVGFTFDAQILFPDLAKIGKFTIHFEPEGAPAQQVDIHVLPVFDPARDYSLELDTSFGPLNVDLSAKEAPVAVLNIVQLARIGFYDNAPIPRLQPGFAFKVSAPIGEKHRIVPFEKTASPLLAGTVVVEPAQEGSSQVNYPNLIFLLGPQPQQQGSATVVGQVTKGQDLLAKLADMPTSGAQGKPPWSPRVDLRIKSITVVEK